MRFRTRAALLAVLTLSVAGCDDAEAPDSPGAAPTAPFSPRPLALPSVGTGEACPTATPRRGPSDDASVVLGDGPLHPVAHYFRNGATLELRPDDRQPDGSYVKKVRWVGVGYEGPVVLRADRIDGPGTASARFSYRGTPGPDGFSAELPARDNDLPATTTVSGPGCYAYQVDGASFSETIVFRAVTVPK
ncbi:hypothetical protein [Cryptosporangium minutisporangium]|uniref:Lipoprotein n=1 Tax=Cryptosporangium minutisporangium TaxID=113569 RepID=A0ABP6TCM9_9ACTN